MTTHKKLRKQFEDVISVYKDIPLSDGDIMKIVNGQANVVTYPNIHKYKSIDELLAPHGACCILYETHEHYGHWVCLTIRNEDLYGTGTIYPVLEYFDSYGEEIDYPLNVIPVDFAKNTHQDKPYLSELMLDDSCTYQLSYNEHQFQKFSPNVKDCGRWIATRIILKDMPLDDFIKLFKGMYSDDIVTAITCDPSQLQNSV